MRKSSKVEDYYDHIEMSGMGQQLGILGWLRKRLLVFEEHRIRTSIKMIPSGIEKMLDVGCKNGDLLIGANDKFGQACGLDISGEAIKIARQNVAKAGLSKKIFLKRVDVEDGLPFSNDSFDMVTCVAVLEHLFNPEKAVREMSRVLRRGGYLIVGVPNIAWFPRRLALLFGFRPRTSWAEGWDGGHLNYFTLRDLKELLKNLGFEIIKVCCSGIFARLRCLYLSLLSGNIIILSKKTGSLK
jgi:SAM-dependent methyltransferase